LWEMGDMYSCDTVVGNGRYVQLWHCCGKWAICAVVTLLWQMGDMYSCDTVVTNGRYVQLWHCCGKWAIFTDVMFYLPKFLIYVSRWRQTVTREPARQHALSAAFHFWKGAHKPDATFANVPVIMCNWYTHQHSLWKFSTKETEDVGWKCCKTLLQLVM
jgi:hypothetical protein